ncbi:dihydroxyacetone kinase phosphoryl donor subunit DhaM [Actinokineospora sp. UTMC 2448]|uniref:dihydroxyacetone kinase phosphoryl donor subunit DhaM n=1 Tax=Actinokineospora sp. UTMC 2448 TaxID=2268449 RepID=UPI002164DF31|nr:dihydroxyacetone kinase phosphoryl donor subunit DhaM [Actinokineospora sp. UTMC 2448]UVS81342.1 PTS-dependent dihydroxyacetone kinase, phosphotransferase subunit DhaM [Actinokineospora sp. UTMC 2448]
MTRVGLVLVSHSARLADGLAELAAQMAPDVAIIPAGGSDGELGTDFDLVSDALSRAQSGAGVVLLYDLGSAKLVADIAVEMLGDPTSAAVVDAPLVEGAIAAAAAAQSGADLDAVLSAAASALSAGADGPTASGNRVEIELTNDVGLHARPAGLLVRALADLDAEVTVEYQGRTADARSVLGLLGLGAPGGARVSVTADGPDASEALGRVEDLAARRFAS